MVPRPIASVAGIAGFVLFTLHSAHYCDANCIPSNSNSEEPPPRCCEFFGKCGFFSGGKDCAPPGSDDDDVAGVCPAILDQCQESACSRAPGCECRFISKTDVSSIPNDDHRGLVICQGEITTTSLVDTAAICQGLSYDTCTSAEDICQWDGTDKPTKSPTPAPTISMKPTLSPTLKPILQPTTPTTTTNQKPTSPRPAADNGKCAGTIESFACGGIFYETCDKEPFKDSECEPVRNDCDAVCDSSVGCICDQEEIDTTTDFLQGVDAPIPLVTFHYKVECVTLQAGGDCIVFDKRSECNQVDGCQWKASSAGGIRSCSSSAMLMAVWGFGYIVYMF